MATMTRSRILRSITWSVMALVLGGMGAIVGAAPASAGGSCHSDATAARGTAVFIDQLCFGPTVLYAKPGATVTWTNKDTIGHTVTGLGFGWGSSSDLFQNGVYSHVFAAPGIYPYACIIHPGMVGAVVVGNAASPVVVGSVAAVVPPAAAPSTTAAPVAAPVAASQPRPTSSSPWLIVSLAALGILLAGGTLITVQRRRLPGRAGGATA